MGRILDARERGVLDALQLDHSKFQIKAALPFGIGRKTLDGLVNLGLLEMGPSKLHYGQVGYRLTPNGWRTMYGMTYEEIMAQPAGKGVRPLRVWSCPPSCNLSRSG
ncbi:MAG TPA: hypothetical protein VET25_07780 [Aestuariivirgaceae bacterium]|nr:hypothetical protein [Aestuariivirgaceae bacterium]